MASPAEIYQGLIDRGMTPTMAHGVMANFKAESGFNAGINEQNPTVAGSRGGFGYGQWTGPRRVALEDYAHEQGVAPGDSNLQLDFLMRELNGPESGAMRGLQGADSPEEAARVFEAKYERPGVSNGDYRARLAAGFAGKPYDIREAALGDSDGGRPNQQPYDIMQAAFGDSGPQRRPPPIFAKQHAALLDTLGMNSKQASGMGNALSMLGRSMMG